MAFMKKTDEEEQRFFEDYRPQGMLQVKGRLSNDLWTRHLFHPDENLYISKIFEMIAPAALQAKIAQLKAQNKLPVLDKRFKQDPANSTVTFAKTFGWAAQVLGVPSPELYVRNDVPGSVVAVPAVPPASVAGQTVLTGFQPQELTFICGKHLAQYRGEHYIRTLFPTQAELTIMLFAGVMIAAPNTPMPQDTAKQIRATAQELAKYMQPVQMEGLRMVVKRFIEEGAKANIKRWNQAVGANGLSRRPAGLRRPRDRQEDHQCGAAAPGRSVGRRQDEGAARVQRQRGLRAATQGARHRHRLAARAPRGASAPRAPAEHSGGDGRVGCERLLARQIDNQPEPDVERQMRARVARGLRRSAEVVTGVELHVGAEAEVAEGVPVTADAQP